MRIQYLKRKNQSGVMKEEKSIGKGLVKMSMDIIRLGMQLGQNVRII